VRRAAVQLGQLLQRRARSARAAAASAPASSLGAGGVVVELLAQLLEPGPRLGHPHVERRPQEAAAAQPEQAPDDFVPVAEAQSKALDLERHAQHCRGGR